MKHRRILMLLALVVVAAGIVLCWPRGPKEPWSAGGLAARRGDLAAPQNESTASTGSGRGILSLL